MEICESGHDQIVFDGNKCPLCEANEEIDTLKETVADMKSEIKAIEANQAE